MLNEPFFTSEECNNLNWPSDNKLMDVDEILDNEDIRSIIRKYTSMINEYVLTFP